MGFICIDVGLVRIFYFVQYFPEWGMHLKLWQADISKYRNVHLLFENDVGYLMLHPGWCLDGHCGASVWVIEH